MGLYIHLNRKLWENKDIDYIPIQPRRVTLLQLFDELRKCLGNTMGFEQGEISLWKTDIIEELGGQRVDGNPEEGFRSNPWLILLSRGFVNFKEKVPVRIVVSDDRDYGGVFGDIHLEVEPDSQYEDIVELLNSLNYEDYRGFLGKITETLSEFNKNSMENIQAENRGIKNIIDYAYISEFPVNRDMTEMYYLYRPTGSNVDPVTNILDMVAETVLNNRDFEDEVPQIIKSNKSSFTRRDLVVKFLSKIERVREILDGMSSEYLTIDTAHSLVIEFSRSKGNREEFFVKIKDGIITPFFYIFPAENEIREKYLEKIEEQSNKF